MRQISCEVRHQGELLGTVQVPQFESLNDALAGFSRNELIELINQAVKRKLTSRFRRAAIASQSSREAAQS